jgi:hypothetical protein
MVMKVKHTGDYVLDGQDTEMVYKAIREYADALDNYQTWAARTELPSKDEALANIREEIKAYRELSLDMYERLFKRAIVPFERNRVYEREIEDVSIPE